jgi:hypothetical protein
LLDIKDTASFFSRTKGIHENLYMSHVRKGEAVAKFWLEPEPVVSESYAISARELRELFDVAVENKDLIKRYWNEHFGV